MLGAIVVVLIVLAGGYFSRAFWWPGIAPALDETVADLPAVEDLQSRLGLLDNRVSGLDERAGDLASGQSTLQSTVTASLEELRSRASQQSESLSALQGASRALQDQIAAVTERVTALEELLEALRETEPAITAARDDATAALAERIRRLETQAALLAQIDKHDDQLSEQADRLNAMAARFDELSDVSSQIERIEVLEAAVNDLQARAVSAQQAAVDAAAVAAAVAELREKLTSSAPFAAELERFKAALPEDQSLAEAAQAIEPYASSGIPTFAALYRKLPEVAEGVIQADAKVEGDDWSATAVNDLMSLLTIRKTKEASGVHSDLTDAQDAMAQGDLASAVAALERIDEAQTPQLEAWIKDARARLAAERLLSRLQLYAVSLSAAQGG